MNVSIKSGTNNILYAYGLIDPDSDITYHETQRGSRILSLRSYNDPSLESKFTEFDYFDFRLDNNKFLIESIDQDFIHHILMYECDLMVQFNDSNLPEGFCNKTKNQIELCRFNVAGDYMIEYPSEAGYPIGGDFNIKYYMIEIHFNNPNQISSIQYN
ncbi:unnamed protein product [Rotaria sp. Silwood2]|nr:unnamed protein product [Rotaria sp. Silwood2]